jgi:hypothetical protein
MLDEFKVINVEPKIPRNFAIRRKVLVEKFDRNLGTSIFKTYKHYINTILCPGEYIWTIDTTSLIIERRIISAFPLRFKADSNVFLLSRSGESFKTGFDLHSYLTKMNTTAHIRVGDWGSPEKFICSSERDVLLVLKKYIPELIKKIQANVKTNSMQIDRRLGKQARIKKLQKLHKKLVVYLKEN